MANRKILLDSDVFIWYLRGNNPYAYELLSIAGTSKLFLSPISIAEICAGLRENEKVVFDQGIQLTTVLEIDFEIGRQAGIFLAKYGKSHGLKIADALIVATCVNFDLEMWTLNVKHYPMLKKSQFYK